MKLFKWRRPKPTSEMKYEQSGLNYAGNPQLLWGVDHHGQLYLYSYQDRGIPLHRLTLSGLRARLAELLENAKFPPYQYIRVHGVMVCPEIALELWHSGDLREEHLLRSEIRGEGFENAIITSLEVAEGVPLLIAASTGDERYWFEVSGHPECKPIVHELPNPRVRQPAG